MVMIMGNITVKIDDQLEDRLREYIWNKYRGKGRHMGAVIEGALTEFLDKQEQELEG